MDGKTNEEILKNLEERFLDKKVTKIDYDKLSHTFYLIFENGEEVEV